MCARQLVPLKCNLFFLQGQYYKRTAGDSKGFTSIKFEEQNPGVIAAFANVRAGYISGNMVIPTNQLKTDKARMAQLGNAYYTTAQKIFDCNDHTLEGLINFHFQQATMVNYKINEEGGKVL
jgi:hypothetical protein